jgi:hypothetical protein
MSAIMEFSFLMQSSVISSNVIINNTVSCKLTYLHLGYMQQQYNVSSHLYSVFLEDLQVLILVTFAWINSEINMNIISLIFLELHSCTKHNRSVNLLKMQDTILH